MVGARWEGRLRLGCMGTVAPRGRSPRGQELGSMEAGASRSRAGAGRSRAGASSRQGKGALATTTPTIHSVNYIPIEYNTSEPLITALPPIDQ